ncbi:MAG: hypothetical protein ABJC13_20125 [Acidobacteriota bacterium]
MKRLLAIAGLLALTLGPMAPSAEAAHVRVVRRVHRTRVVIHSGFPIHRVLPQVYIRPPHIAIRVTPRVFLPPVVFGAGIAANIPDGPRAWQEDETLSRADSWTEFSLNVNARGSRLLLDVTGGPAQISFAEVVFENGETQVVDFNDRAQKLGVYNLLDFRDGRQIDHVRLVAKASDQQTTIGLRLL